MTCRVCGTAGVGPGETCRNCGKAQPTPCGCRPGSEEGGWHEERCPRCEADEREAWDQAMAKFQEDFDGIVEEIRRREAT